MRQKLYRAKSLERLSTPEQLDLLVQPATTRSWLALAATGLVILALSAWGVLGRVADTVDGAGILLHEGGVFGIQAPASGVIVRMLVTEGMEIPAGGVVAHIAQPQLEDELREARSRETALREISERTAGLVEEGTRLQVAGIQQQRHQLAARLNASREHAAYLETRLAQDQEALHRGLITPGDHHSSLQQLQAARDAVAGALAEVAELEARIPMIRNQSLQTLLSYDDRIREATERVLSLEDQLRIRSSVISPYHGRVLEILADDGEAVASGSQLMLLEMPNRPIEAVVFVSEAGRRMQPGMTVRMSPAGLKAEEFGYLLGTARSISEFPSTAVHMNRVMRNPALVQSLGAQGNTYMVMVDLTQDSTTVSGYRWTSRRGPPLMIGSGTMVSAIVSVRVHRPISLVFPSLRRWFGA
jgi:HlyD family secretion protein